jgi:sulfide:quinone oxidoreductase
MNASISNSRAGRPVVLIVGGGVAGMEAMLALRALAEDRIDLVLVTPEPEFTYRPLLVDEPFLTGVAQRYELAPIARELGVEHVQQALAAVRPDEHRVDLADGSSRAYDMLVVCTGGKLRAPYSRGFTFPPVDGGNHSLNDWLRTAEQAQDGRLVFVIPPGISWPLPLYEIALMTERLARKGGLDHVRCTVVTPETAPLIVFGSVASDAVAELLRARGIAVRTGTHARELDDGTLELIPGEETLAPDAVVSLAHIEGPSIAGLPHEGDGFIPIDAHARVTGLDDVYAAGDGTNFPVKQGGIATQQADAAAEHIAARAGTDLDPQPFRPVLRGKLLTGDESLSLRHEIAGGAGEGVASDDYLWWPPHKISGRYLAPWLAGESVHRDPTPPRRTIDVEVALPHEWHSQPMGAPSPRS